MAVRLPVLAGLMALAVAARSQPDAAPAITEEELVRRVLAGDLADARREVAAARQRAAEAHRVTAPAWTVGTLREESLADATRYSAQVTGVAVSWELASRNRWARESGAAQALQAAARLEADLVDLACDVRELALEASAARARADLLDGTRARVERFADDLRRLVEAGEHSEHDLRQLHAEVAVRASEAALAAAAASALEEEIAALGGARVDPASREAAPLPADSDSLVGLAMASDPRLRELARAAEAARADAEVARRSFPAELEVRGAHRSDDEPGLPRGDGYEVELAVTLPSPSLRRAELARARADELAIAAELRSAERAAERAIRALHARLAALPEADAAGDGAGEELIEGSRRRYEAGEGSMTEMLDVLAAVERSGLADLELSTQRQRARTDLDCATGLATAPALRAVVEEKLP